MFNLFGKRKGGTITAHVLDPNSGYSKEQWTVGEDLSKKDVSRLEDGKNIYIVVAYEKGEANRVACKKEVWEQARVQFDDIKPEGAESVQRKIERMMANPK